MIKLSGEGAWAAGGSGGPGTFWVLGAYGARQSAPARWAQSWVRRQGHPGMAGSRFHGQGLVSQGSQEEDCTPPQRTISSPDSPKEGDLGQQAFGPEIQALPMWPANTVGVLCAFYPAVT